MIQLSLSTAAERAAALRALTVYVNTLDGLAAAPSIRTSAAAPFKSEPWFAPPVVIAPEDVPDVGAPLPPLPVAVAAVELTAAEVFGTPVLSAQQAADVLFGQHAAPPAVELDSAGQPWSAELHASSKAKISDGTWRKKRNTAEAAPAPVPMPPAAPAPVPMLPVPAPVTVTPQDLVQAFMAALMAQKIDGAAINSLCAKHGVPNMVALPQHADKVAVIMADFRVLVPA